MKIVTEEFVILDHNIISIYTNIEKFIGQLQIFEQDMLLSVEDKEKVKLKNMLSISHSKNGAKFFGVFYSLDPFFNDVDFLWSVLKNKKEYNNFLKALDDDILFDMSNHTYDEDFDVTEVGLNDDYDYALDEEDEYDEDELEFELEDYLTETDDEE